MADQSRVGISRRRSLTSRYVYLIIITILLSSDICDWLERLAVHHTGRDTTYHFWEPGGGYDRNIIITKAAHAVVEHIHNNPVRRGLVDPPEPWPWSRAGLYAGQQDVKLEMDPTRPEIGRSSSLRCALGQQ